MKRKGLAVAALPFAAGLWLNATPASAQASRQWDSNGDGVITRAEWRGTRAAFAQLDINRDGVLSGTEIGDDNRPVGTTGTASSRRSEFFTLDLNEDGVVTRDEWTGNRFNFNRQDLNGDGVITRREYVGIEADNNINNNTRLGGGGNARLRNQASQVVMVNPRTAWTDTGFYVNQGDVITFNTSGQVQLSEGGDDSAGPAGSGSGRRAANAPLPDAPAGALIGRIGNSAAFGIGDQTVLRAPASGVLYLGVNDDHLADNNGRFGVGIGIR